MGASADRAQAAEARSQDMERRFAQQREALETRCTIFETEAKRVLAATSARRSSPSDEPHSPDQRSTKSSDAFGFGLQVAGKMDELRGEFGSKLAEVTARVKALEARIGITERDEQRLTGYNSTPPGAQKLKSLDKSAEETKSVCSGSS